MGAMGMCFLPRTGYGIVHAFHVVMHIGYGLERRGDGEQVVIRRRWLVSPWRPSSLTDAQGRRSLDARGEKQPLERWHIFWTAFLIRSRVCFLFQEHQNLTIYFCLISIVRGAFRDPDPLFKTSCSGRHITPQSSPLPRQRASLTDGGSHALSSHRCLRGRSGQAHRDGSPSISSTFTNIARSLK